MILHHYYRSGILYCDLLIRLVSATRGFWRRDQFGCEGTRRACGWGTCSLGVSARPARNHCASRASVKCRDEDKMVCENEGKTPGFKFQMITNCMKESIV